MYAADIFIGQTIQTDAALNPRHSGYRLI